MASLVKPEYGPTLAAILARRSRLLTIALAAVVIAVVAVAGAALVRKHAGERTAVVLKPVTFNLAYGGQFKRVSTPGTMLDLEHSAHGLFLDSLLVRKLVLPPYSGAVGGTLPVYASSYIRGLRHRYKDFELIEEGRTRVNNAIGYQVIFRAHIGARSLYGRHVFLFAQAPDGVRVGLLVEVASTPAAGTPNAQAVGQVGALKTPYRSLRLGTDRSGGEA